MNRYLLKVNGLTHGLNAIPQPESGADWEGGEVLIASEGPVRQGNRGWEQAEPISEGDELWIWAHESDQHGKGLGMTARAIAGPSRVVEDAIAITLTQVERLHRPFGFRAAFRHPNPPPILLRIHENSWRRTYLIEPDEVDEFVAFCTEQSSPITDEQQRNYVDPIDLYVTKQKVESLEDLAQRKMVSVKERRDQGVFRAALMERDGRRCVVTGCTIEEALEAAHILPHNGDPVRDLPDNGLLLRRDLHRLFDEYLWSIDPKQNKVVLSDRLKKSQYSNLDGKAVQLEADARLMALHFIVFKGQEG